MEFEGLKVTDIDPSIFAGKSILQEATERLVIDVINKKEQVVKDRLKELDITIDWDLEKTRRFKSILREYHADTGHEVYYYNDGTEQGQRIVTFVPNKETTPSGGELTMGYSYY